jgi:hypothetical protein
MILFSLLTFLQETIETSESFTDISKAMPSAVSVLQGLDGVRSSPDD